MLYLPEAIFPHWPDLDLNRSSKKFLRKLLSGKRLYWKLKAQFLSPVYRSPQSQSLQLHLQSRKQNVPHRLLQYRKRKRPKLKKRNFPRRKLKKFQKQKRKRNRRYRTKQNRKNLQVIPAVTITMGRLFLHQVR